MLLTIDLESQRFARSMAEMKDLNQTPLLMDLVVDENRGVDQLTDPRSPSSEAPHAGKPAEQTDVVE